MGLRSIEKLVLERSQFTLSDKLRQILVGLLLGDLYAQKQKSYANARLFFQQGLVHEDYLLHLYELFKTYSSQAPKITNLPPDKRTFASSMHFASRPTGRMQKF